MDKIRYIIDRRGRRRYPVTHEKGVRDSRYQTLDNKLAGLSGRLDQLEEHQAEENQDSEPVVNNTPLIIEGILSGGEFLPGDSGVSHSDVAGAFLSRTIIFSYIVDGDWCHDMVVCVNGDTITTSRSITWTEASEPVEEE